MKVKTKTEKVRQLMLSKPNATVDEVMEAAKIKRPSAHVLMWKIRREMKGIRPAPKKERSFSVVVPVPPEVRALTHGVDIDKAHVKPKAVTVEPVKPIATVTDFVNQPPHYKVGNIETIDFIEAKKLNYNLGNVVKYIARADHKGNRDQDLQKAMWYLKRELGLDLV